MNRELKYIVVDSFYPVIFPNTLVHADVAYRVGHITGAGFCRKGPKGWQCWGRSESLDINSAESDEELLNKWFA